MKRILLLAYLVIGLLLIRPIMAAFYIVKLIGKMIIFTSNISTIIFHYYEKGRYKIARWVNIEVYID